MGNHSTEHKEPWQAIAVRKRAEREAKIPAEWQFPPSLFPGPDVLDVSTFPRDSGLLDDHELQLTDATASEVVANIATGVWTSEQVTRAICKRAVIAQRLVNCLTEICFEAAIERAKALDARLRIDGKPVGPLHGLPVSLKDQFNVPGLDTTLGYIAKAGHPVKTKSTLVDVLEQAGAVIYVKTSVPTTLMMGETINNVFGRTLNPYNLSLTPGGSSGGEAALIALGGSHLGVGTDIGGSIRHPCHCTGLYGLRPSHGRVSYQKVATTFVGQEAIRSVAGPMCRSPEDVRLFMSAVIAAKPWLQDPQCLPIPWRSEEEILPEKLCFGIAMSDGRVAPTPPLRRALHMTKRALEAAGHKVINFTPVESIESHEIIKHMFSADGGEEFQRDTEASGEPLPIGVEKWLGKTANAPRATAFETWQNQRRREVLGSEWCSRWNATTAETGTGRPIDGLIMPTVVFPAAEHDASYPSHYGTLSPVLDLTTGSFPVTRVDCERDVVEVGWEALSEEDRRVMETYERPEKFRNSPIGLSIIGRRLEEEKVTAMLGVIRKALERDE
ncbi:hypothetical protein DOTSEDRAFT_74034 [Dothistroma septosporum NZE10]|uniref:amidase n=1 Tax=Dothistroma septosporum (strain NZE10 / CBS 128990) TaxID=675120 RepID=N1PKK9_DOTSN|nr:hypothetical protein DOTSEDRAFT_74034 [Dothistroma septosporum NZE10]